MKTESNITNNKSMRKIILFLTMTVLASFVSYAGTANPSAAEDSPLFELRNRVNVAGMNHTGYQFVGNKNADNGMDYSAVAAGLANSDAAPKIPFFSLGIASGCFISICGGSGCLGSVCFVSGCFGSVCGASGCGGSACGASGCAGSGCGGSACAGSVCVGSGCEASVCVGSLCIGSACGGSACVGSGCGLSVCVGSVCYGSACGTSACVESSCGVSACAAGGCYASTDTDGHLNLAALDYQLVDNGVQIQFASENASGNWTLQDSAKKSVTLKGGMVNRFKINGNYSKIDATQDKDSNKIVVQCYLNGNVVNRIVVCPPAAFRA